MGGTLVIEGVSYIDISGRTSSFEKAVLSTSRSILSRMNAMRGLLKNYLTNLDLIVEKKVETPEIQTIALPTQEQTLTTAAIEQEIPVVNFVTPVQEPLVTEIPVQEPVMTTVAEVPAMQVETPIQEPVMTTVAEVPAMQVETPIQEPVMTTVAEVPAMQVETPIQEPIKKDLYVVETSKNRTVRVPQVYLGYFIKSKEAIDKGTQEPVVAAAKEETTPVQEPVVAAAMEETTPVQEPIVVVAMEEQIKPEESVEVEKPKEMDNVSAIGPTSNDNIKSMIEDVAKMKSERDNAVNENETLRERLLKETEKANSLNSKLSELELNNGKLSGELVSLKSELVEVNDRHSQENSLLKSKLTIMENKVNDLTDAASRVDEYKNRAEQAEHKLIYVLDNLQGVINNDSKQKAA